MTERKTINRPHWKERYEDLERIYAKSRDEVAEVQRQLAELDLQLREADARVADARRQGYRAAVLALTDKEPEPSFTEILRKPPALGNPEGYIMRTEPFMPPAFEDAGEHDPFTLSY